MPSLRFALYALIALLPAHALALEITTPLQYESPRFLSTGNGTYSVRLSGLTNTVDGGMPSVPTDTRHFALPPGYSLVSAYVEEERRLRYALPVEKAPGMSPLSWGRRAPAGLARVAEPRIAGDRFPAARLAVEVSPYHGVPVAIVTVYPLLVDNDGIHSSFLERGRLRLVLEKSSAARDAATLLPHQRRDVETLVGNPSVVEGYAERRIERGAAVDYLILSTASLIGYTGANGFSDLQASLLKRGLTSSVVDLATVEQGQGSDREEKIRNFIRAEYQGRGVRYVLLAGPGRTGGSAIPARLLWSKVRAYNGFWTEIDLEIPSDFYYACLDGSFNGNGNAKWGEPDDGDNGGDVDFLCEVTTGRVVLESSTDLQNFVRKTRAVHEKGIKKKTLLLGETLFQELGLFGGDYMKQLVGKTEEHGFVTQGYGNDWAEDHLYDNETAWSGRDVITRANAGDLGMVNHLGHSNQNYNMKMTSSSLSSFRNDDPFFFYTQGCYAGAFQMGSIVDKMVRHEKVAVAAVANSVYGLAPEDPTPSTTKTPGASHMLHRRFIDALMTGSVPELGRAHQASKAAFAGLKSAQEIRWVQWTATYFGDPSLTLK